MAVNGSGCRGGRCLKSARSRGRGARGDLGRPAHRRVRVRGGRTTVRSIRRGAGIASGAPGTSAASSGAASTGQPASPESANSATASAGPVVKRGRVAHPLEVGAGERAGPGLRDGVGDHGLELSGDAEVGGPRHLQVGHAAAAREAQPRDDHTLEQRRGHRGGAAEDDAEPLAHGRDGARWRRSRCRPGRGQVEPPAAVAAEPPRPQARPSAPGTASRRCPPGAAGSRAAARGAAAGPRRSWPAGGRRVRRSCGPGAGVEGGGPRHPVDRAGRGPVHDEVVDGALAAEDVAAAWSATGRSTTRRRRGARTPPRRRPRPGRTAPSRANCQAG